jgi:4'-phosphopantetheinyl transferase EntD
VSADPALVQALTESVLPAGIAVAARNPRDIPGAPDPSEALAVENAVPRRLAEFHAGRAAARAAMVALSLPPRPVPMGPDRAPVWPAGVTGSISHSATACVAAVGHAEDWAGIGVDIEEDSALAPLLVAEICTRAERIWLGTQPGPERGVMAKLIFSAKEAAYKAQYPLTGQLFGFDALEVRIDRVETVFEARFLAAQGCFEVGTVLAGAYVHAAGLIVTGVALGHADLAGLSDG